MDIRLMNGDIYFLEGDIILDDSLIQEIEIKLRWFLEEWKFSPETGIPYFEELFIKNPNIDFVESLLIDQLMEIEKITDVEKLEITLDRANRKAFISYEVRTELEVIRQEVELWESME